MEIAFAICFLHIEQLSQFAKGKRSFRALHFISFHNINPGYSVRQAFRFIEFENKASNHKQQTPNSLINYLFS